MLERFDAAVERLEQQREPRAAAAAALAEAIVNGADFAVAGCPALRLDMAHRPGAMLGYGGTPAEPGDAVLYRLEANAASEAELSRHVARIAELARGGSVVVVLAPRDRLVSLGHLRAVERHAVAVLDVASGLPCEGKLHDVVALTAAWALHVELFAACVERSEVPVVRMHSELDRRSDRLLRYMGQRFHDDRWLDPAPAGERSRAFLERVKQLSLELRTASGNALERAAWRCRDAARFGGRVYVAGGPRTIFLRNHLRPAGGSLTAWPGVDRLAAPLGPEDVVLGFCNVEPPDVAHWPDVEAMRRAGRGVIWIMPAFGITPRDLPDGDVLLDNQMPFADAAISVDRYDARLGPLSSIANELILATLSTAAEPAEK
ncbi:MAG: hypothetical protein ACOC3G_02725 [Phycisphaeraceae bacterium]